MMYRCAWSTRQEDGSMHLFSGPEYRSLAEAIEYRNATAGVDSVIDAWVETATWTRMPDDVAAHLAER